MPSQPELTQRGPNYDPVEIQISNFNMKTEEYERRAKASLAAESQPGHPSPHPSETGASGDTVAIKVEEEDSPTADPPEDDCLVLALCSTDYTLPDQSNRLTINYLTLRRLIRLRSLWDYLTFAGLDEDQVDAVVPILKGQCVTNWDLFLFPKYISEERLGSWGIPYGICVRLVVHAEMFYRYLAMHYP
ncbi:uncharacterized protein MELLADRAFT_94156 [Melampsora larici-populina 98AG31]|uniref:Uncharacterized protein n=1 Tax=Melampsora larici-populina (strain 98AG31 / pathotype 3-4-7) TaxID=747676 RepID=F4S6P2_MELLP|nr:uncharacterized protein MELLADRAFT_94156 [Melampsora larici-populina 98AG31]EGF99725.1 hypothetical protein MELLADRAFT_94156 [Melampsora larici-populina 98AG31]